MKRLALLALALATVAPSLADAQYVRRPTRYLFVDPPPPPQVVVQPAPPPVLVVRPTPPPHRVRVHVHHVPDPEPVQRTERDEGPHWFLGAGAGALLRFDGAHRDATPSYRLDVGVGLGQAEFGLRFDLAPSFQTGEDRAALYTAGAAFGYRFLEDSRIHPVIGFGLESVFFNPADEESSRAFALTGRLGLDMDVPTNFGALAVGLDVTGHQPLAGAEQAQATLLGIGAHFDLRFH